uniref:Uncharacterized protein n=1 Tax=Utricularia reniformis TaxID=192314 RepID=A0A1Y0B0C4_9LAMI|nr:hypothetical protein AEK19_MT0583 [Utricularia reniformis]ART30839.1 hypothetical protein AEK19_MT0583 [Utricularia reniformis]
MLQLLGSILPVGIPIRQLRIAICLLCFPFVEFQLSFRNIFWFNCIPFLQRFPATLSSLFHSFMKGCDVSINEIHLCQFESGELLVRMGSLSRSIYSGFLYLY